MSSHSLHKAASTLAELLRQRADQQPERHGYCFLLDGDGTEAQLSYGELDRRARGLGAALQRLGATGERALLLYPPGCSLARHLVRTAERRPSETAAEPGEVGQFRRPRSAAGIETDIAVIGLAGRFPGAPDVHRLWQNLIAGVAGLRVVGRLKDRLRVDVSEVSLYEAPTIAAMARLIGAELQAEPAAAPAFETSRSRGGRRKALQLQKARAADGPVSETREP